MTGHAHITDTQIRRAVTRRPAAAGWQTQEAVLDALIAGRLASSPQLAATAPAPGVSVLRDASGDPLAILQRSGEHIILRYSVDMPRELHAALAGHPAVNPSWLYIDSADRLRQIDTELAQPR